jgi:hypothetical protein
VAAEAKTKPTKEKVTDFLNRVSDDTRRADCYAVAKMMEEITGSKAQMWGPAIVGFGTYSYKYASGHSGDWPLAAFSPRKTDLTIYLSVAFEKKEELLSQLGKHKTGKSCLYIKRLADVDLPTLKKLIKASVKDAKERY